jgi:hypothetical protein
MNHKSESSLTLPNLIQPSNPRPQVAGGVPGQKKEFDYGAAISKQ